MEDNREGIIVRWDGSAQMRHSCHVMSRTRSSRSLIFIAPKSPSFSQSLHRRVGFFDSSQIGSAALDADSDQLPISHLNEEVKKCREAADVPQTLKRDFFVKLLRGLDSPSLSKTSPRRRNLKFVSRRRFFVERPL